ncbi:unnamed protein product, partial [Didymodactylos carnosus]
MLPLLTIQINGCGISNDTASISSISRRNALRDLNTIRCRRLQACLITWYTRRRCTYCRLIKCFQNGMRKDWIMTDEQKETKKRKIEANRSLRQSTFFPYETIHPEINNDLIDLIDFGESYFQISQQSSCLSLTDMMKIDNIQASYSQRIQLAALSGLPCDPRLKVTSFYQLLNIKSVILIRLMSYFKQIPEFQALNVDDKVTLIKYNLIPLLPLNLILSYNPDTETFIETDTDYPIDSRICLKFHGTEMYIETKQILDSLWNIASYDHTIIKLALIILIFSKGFSPLSYLPEPYLKDALQVYHAQNFYVELL